MSGFHGIKRQALTTQIRIQRALEELKKRGVKSDYCPRCETSDWNVDILEIPANSEMSTGGGAGPTAQIYPRSVVFTPANGVLPLLGIVCKNCGYSIFHNLNILGIGAE